MTLEIITNHQIININNFYKKKKISKNNYKTIKQKIYLIKTILNFINNYIKKIKIYKNNQKILSNNSNNKKKNLINFKMILIN